VHAFDKIATATKTYDKICIVWSAAWHDLHTYNMLPTPLR